MPSSDRPPARGLGLLAAALFLASTLPRTVSSEIFLDGTTYAAVARNMAEGWGSFFAPCYTDDFCPFREHPPLGFFLQSLAFRVLGDTPWIDVLWGVLLGAVAVWLLGILWRQALEAAAGVSGAASVVPSAAWPAALFLLSPIVGWCLTNNLLENAMLVFVLASALAGFAAARAETRVRRALLSAGCGLCLAAALLVKGPPAAFVLAVPILAAASLPSIRARDAAETLAVALFAALVGILSVGLLDPQASLDYLRFYARVQILGSVRGAKEVAPESLYLLKILVREIAAPFAAALLAWFAGRRNGERLAPRAGRAAVVFVGTGLCGSLPFSLFPKQMEWYVLPSLPFFAIGLGLFAAAGARRLEAFLSATPARRLAIAAVAGTIAAAALAVPVFAAGRLDLGFAAQIREWTSPEDADERTSEYCWRHFSRDMIAEGRLVDPGAAVADRTRRCRWRAIAYAERHLRVTLTPRGAHRLLLVERDPGDDAAPPDGCEVAQRRNPQRFVLYRCEKPQEGDIAVAAPPPARRVRRP